MLSGTSMDGIDVAAAEVVLDGTTIRLRHLGSTSTPYPAGLRDELVRATSGRDCDAGALCRLDTRIGERFARAAVAGTELAGGRADLVASLGQTAHHWIDAHGRARGTLQLGAPAWIAERTGLPVVADFRARDVAAGGQGAPLAAVLDALWLPGTGFADVALNLGGIANLTLARPGRTLAFDTGPGNALLDLAAQRATGIPQDAGGALAGSGHVHADLLDLLLDDPYYRRSPPKSTGKEHFGAAHLDAALHRLGTPIDAADLLATLTELTAETAAAACRDLGAAGVVVSGGGVHNPVLLTALRSRLDPIPLRTSDEFGMPADDKEALLTALLGVLTWHGIAADVPAATGAAGPRLLGSVTPGAEPLRMPEPAEQRPRELLVLPAETEPEQP
ncbi:anhydro-N-acetylmuramic acid kinase [Saccharopolyspora sp. HNM0983]|uniref:Anhydro-N-acetylmuramic acid kinase n=1 Tax=Saccharopolyspora montiporae TaxID=2781240 RepID=A0A929FZI1_9PSEU|nr:anhydro-N-acetylmuramic acid kinase [Saccharopolyspora sp. HNM0983]MBE9374394.1 anhydro-N-acetylmuramic acid kinase [Saccharopolyspora sp. HNM0983]